MPSYRVVSMGDRIADAVRRTRVSAYIHVRDTDAGCYDFCIEKASEENDLHKGEPASGGYSHE